MNANHHNDLEVGDDLVITKTTRRASGGRDLGLRNDHGALTIVESTPRY